MNKLRKVTLSFILSLLLITGVMPTGTTYSPVVSVEAVVSKKQTAKNEGSDSKAVQSSSGKININTAGVKELMTLSGIGEAKASDIISYREEHGPFSDISDIMKIQGIKEGIYHKIKDKITI